MLKEYIKKACLLPTDDGSVKLTGNAILSVKVSLVVFLAAVMIGVIFGLAEVSFIVFAKFVVGGLVIAPGIGLINMIFDCK